MKNVPEKIYLQTGGPGIVTDFKQLTEVSWCDKPQGEEDIEYIRVKRVTINGIPMVVQAYEKDVFVNLCNEHFSSVRIDFRTKEIATWGKINDTWKAFVAKLDIEEVKKNLENIFDSEN